MFLTHKSLTRFGLLLVGMNLSLALLLGVTANTASADSSADTTTVPNPWPTEATQIGTTPSLNPVWGTAINSDIKWTFDTKGDMPFTNVIVVDGLAYFGSMMNNIYALNAVTGQPVWQFMADNWIMTNPVIADGKLFAGSGNRYYLPGEKPAKGATRGTGSNSLYALDAKTGKMLWQHPVPGEAMPTPLYYQGVVYYVTGDRNLYALDANTGAVLYQQDIGSVFSMGSINRDGNILIFGGGFPFKVYGFNLVTKQMAWETPMPQDYLGLDDSNAAVSNGMLYINAVAYNAPDDTHTNPYNPRHEFYALNTQTGELKWTFNAGVFSIPDDNKSSTPAIVDGVYYGASSLSRQFYAIDAATGALKWKYNIGVVVKGNPVVEDGYVFFADAKGTVYALDTKTGKAITKLNLGGNINPQGPTIYNGTLYVANQNGKVYAMPVLSLIKSRFQAAQPAPTATDKSQGVYFKETGHSIEGAFLAYWQKQGGLSQFGFPVTGELPEYHSQDGQTYTVQYFERARLELHGSQILLGRIGSEVSTATESANSKAFQPVSKPADSTQYFAATGHTALPDFYTYWQANGGLARYGYPISEPFQRTGTDGGTYTVQYFERARFELHTTATGSKVVMLGLLGNEALAHL